MARPREVTDEQILSTAHRVFVEHGPGVSTAVIAAELGVSAPALFHRFGTKRNLLIRAMTLHELVAPTVALDERPVAEQLLELILSLDRSFKAMAPAIGVLKAAGVPPEDLPGEEEDHPPVVMGRAVRAWLGAAVEAERIAPVDVDVAGHMIVGVIMGSNMVLLRLGRGQPPEVPAPRYQELVRLLLKALGPVRD